MRRTCIVAALITVLGPAVLAQVATPTRGRIDRTIDVQGFDDFEFYLPNGTTEISVYAQWSNNRVVVPSDFTLICLAGPDGTPGEEDDDVVISDSRQTSYKVTRGRLWYTTTVSGQPCLLTLDFKHHEDDDRSARAKITIILSEKATTEGAWISTSSSDLQRMEQKRVFLSRDR